jgi:hypothetical protein
MRRSLVSALFVIAFTITTAAPALAGGNENNDQRKDHGPMIPCHGLYTAGVGIPPSASNPTGAAAGTPGYAHVFENDTEMCHKGVDPVGE